MEFLLSRKWPTLATIRASRITSRACHRIITNLSLWDLVFGGGGSSGDPNTLYLTAGGMNEAHGIFASLSPTQASGGNAPSFSLSVSPSSATLTAGSSTSFTINVSPANGFSSPVSLSCSGLPTGASCMFSTSSYNPGGNTAPVLTVTTTAPNANKIGPDASGSVLSLGTPPQLRISSALGFSALILAGLCGLRLWSPLVLSGLIRVGYVAVTLLILLAAAGCGSGASGSRAGATPTPKGTSTIVVTGMSGTLSSQAKITLVVN